jgi:hypothetical protein
MRRYLLLGCSNAKVQDEGELPAIVRYDGPLFRVLRRYMRERLGKHSMGNGIPDVSVLSAEFGLIPGYYPIPHYDRQMTHQRAMELRPQAFEKLGHILKATEAYQELFICMGRDYLQVLDGWEALIPFGLAVKVSKGSMGKQQAELYDWLRGESPSPPSSTPQGKVRIRGTQIDLTSQQVLDAARHALAREKGDPSRYQSWYVQVDDWRVAPKWLVSQITGLPTSAFVTDEARRVLAQLGIEVIRA